MADDEEQDRGFQVRDRRRFTETGDAKAEDSSAEPDAEADGASEFEAPGGSTIEGHDFTAREPSAEDAREISFTSFVMSLSTQALLCLGEVDDPAAKDIPQDLQSARELIDILGVLEEKTKGNLEADEAKLLEAILYDLRLRYVRKSKS